MKFTGIVQNLDRKGRIRIPKELINISKILETGVIEFVVVDKLLILQQHRKACDITGKISQRNISLANGKIKVHSKEVKQLIKELKEYLEENRLLEVPPHIHPGYMNLHPHNNILMKRNWVKQISFLVTPAINNAVNKSKGILYFQVSLKN